MSWRGCQTPLSNTIDALFCVAAVGEAMAGYGKPEICNCKIRDVRFQALPDEITACHSSLGGEFGEWIDVVKDASNILQVRYTGLA